MGTALRWGIVGTGAIAGDMAPMIALSGAGEAVAVASRRMETAEAFATRHGIAQAFHSWVDLIASDGVDAVYVATPTATREEICVAAARAGKHVLAEKPFASLDSCRRITAACRETGVAFMDGTHFVHHPRTHRIQADIRERVGRVRSVASAFQAGLSDRGNIRYDPRLEPMGAIGDLAWYDMRAAVEFLPPGIAPVFVGARARRDPETGAVLGGSGVIAFDDGSTTTVHCAMDSGALVMDLRISGDEGSVSLTDFVGNRTERPLQYQFRRGGFGTEGLTETIAIASPRPAAALMFEDFAKMVDDPALRAASIAASERTQALLDAVWNAALESESQSSTDRSANTT